MKSPEEYHRLEVVSDAPLLCPECDAWLIGQQVTTDDEASYEGIEDWRYCPSCEFEAFYPRLLQNVSGTDPT